MSKKVLLTKEGLSELQEELKELKEVKRVVIAEKLKEAISYGDLSENSEYEDARNDQAQLELRILELEEILKNYELVNEISNSKKGGKINIGSTVTLQYRLEHHKGEKEVLKIVGTTESDIYENKISNESPIGKTLLGKSVGDIIKGKSPAGEFEYEIIDIK